MLTAKQIKLKYGISRASLIEYEEKGLLHPHKTPMGHRRYNESSIRLLLEEKDAYPMLLKIRRRNYGLLPETLKVMGCDGGKNSFCFTRKSDVTNEELQDKWELSASPCIATYVRIPVKYTGTQWLVEDPELKTILAFQIPRIICFEEIKKKSSITVSYFPNEKIYQFQDDNYVDLIQITKDINDASRKYCLAASRYSDLKHEDLACEIPLFIMGEEIDDVNNAIAPVVFRCVNC